MRFGIAAALAFVALSDTSLLAQPRGRRGGGVDAARNGWLSGLEEGKAEARRTGKPLMVVLRCEP